MKISKEEYEAVFQEYEKNQKRVSVEMNRKMVKNKILENACYNTTDMLNEYIKLCELIDETIRIGLPSEKVTCNKKYAEISENALKMELSSNLFTEIEKEVLKANEDFRTNYDEILKQINILKSGVSGEQKLYNRLKIIGDKISIITNAKYRLEDDFVVEHDMIIITCTGVFTVEIKNWNQDSYIDNKGIIHSKNRENFNIVEQTMRHKHHLERILKEYTKESIPVHPIIAWVNSESSIKSDFKHIMICNCNDIEFEIFDEEKYGACYDNEKRSNLYKLLMDLKLPPNEYPVQINKKAIVESLSKVIAGICTYPEMIRVEEMNKTNVFDVIDLLFGLWIRFK